uniref:Uncharacterized protein n=1 Tax=viral metagenome TaxID=1070528 RepID=A0A6C0AZB5_9ZZZZ
MVQFWLNNLPDLFNAANFTFLDNSPKPENYIKVLNIIAATAIIFGISMTFMKKNSIYFAILVVILSLTILIKSYVSTTTSISTFVPVQDPLNTKLTNSYDTGVYLVKAVVNDPSKLNNIIYVNTALNFNKGDILAFSVNGVISETNIVTGVQYTTEPGPNGSGTPVLILLNNIKGDYSKYQTQILKVSDSSPNIIPPPDGNMSIEMAGKTPNGMSDPHTMAVQNYPPFGLPNGNRYDWDLELATMGPNGMPNSYVYQGQPYGNLKCRESTVQNPMGTIDVPEYDAVPTMFGTCNEAEMGSNGIQNNYNMTTNQEATVSQRVEDLLFHKGNSQWHYSPVPVDTIPNDQEGFAHFCYRSPTNLVNPKYASVFVNDPEKFKLVAKLAKATGTENGGGGGY